MEGHSSEQAGPLPLVFHCYVWPVCLDVFVCLDWHVPKYSHCVVFSYGRWPMLEIFVLHFDAIVLITSAEREGKGSRRSGMYQSWHFGDRIGHAKSVGFRFYSAIWRPESRISSRCLEITSISLIYSNLFEEERICFLAFPGLACEQTLLFGQATRAPRERASKGPCPSRLRRSLARSRETRFTRPNRRACSQAIPGFESTHLCDP